jgi:hypothetical protein
MMSHIVLVLLLCALAVSAQTQAAHPTWLGKGRLFVGTCYQPVDRSPDEINRGHRTNEGCGLQDGADRRSRMGFDDHQVVPLPDKLPFKCPLDARSGYSRIAAHGVSTISIRTRRD